MKKSKLCTSLKFVHRAAVRANKKSYVFFLICSALCSFQALVNLASIEYITNSAYALFEKRMEIQSVAEVILLFGLLEILLKIISWLKEKSLLRLNYDMNFDLKQRLNEKLANVEMDYFESHETMVKIHDVKTRMEEVTTKYINSIAAYLSAVPILLIFSYYLSRVNFWYVLIYLILFVVFNGFMGKRFQGIWSLWDSVQKYDQKQQYYFGLCGDKVSHQEYKFNRLYGYFSEIWEKAYEECYKQRLNIFKKFEVKLQISRIVFNIPYITMLILIALEVAEGKQQIGFLIMANSLLNYIIDEYLMLQNQIMENRTDSRTIDNYRAIMGFLNYEKADSRAVHGDIHVEIQEYAYPQSENVALRNICLDLKEHEKVMIVGANGSGKTTFVNILTSLLAAEKKMLTVNGKAVNLKTSIACIFQDFYQYQMSIRENIYLGDVGREITDEELWALLEKVGLKEKVSRLSNGLDTRLGQLENQGDFSKGEWQRLAVARLLAKSNASIWILDEPTAYLDPLSEIELYDMIYQFAGERTVIFISHRLGFAKKTDRILVFDGGQIVEEGNHEELVAQNGVYQKMYSLQQEWYLN